MPNIANVLKQEIARVARKEIRGETESTQKAVAGYRRQIAELKRRMDALERQLKAVNRRGARAASQDDTEVHDGSPHLRFRPDGLKKHRERLGLSAQQAGKIMGVSALSVYKWESGKTRPRAKQLEAIAGLRKLGKREAFQRLET
jgi:DNA-binding transcriptional regulator YiaG